MGRAAPAHLAAAATVLGEHTGSILSDFGYELAELASLRADRVIN